MAASRTVAEFPNRAEDAHRQAEFTRKVGIYHWSGKMAFSMKDGVDRIAAFGARVARVTLAPTYRTDYNVGNGCYPNFSLDEAARIPDVAAALDHPGIQVFTITAYDGVSFGDCATHYYLNPDFYTSQNFQAMVDEYTALTMQLHRAYEGSGKTFIISNWEGDNAIYCGSAYRFAADPEFRNFCEEEYPMIYGGNRSVTDSIAGMILWLRASVIVPATGRTASPTAILSPTAAPWSAGSTRPRSSTPRLAAMATRATACCAAPGWPASICHCSRTSL
jgi:hypothetical protein